MRSNKYLIASLNGFNLLSTTYYKRVKNNCLSDDINIIFLFSRGSTMIVAHNLMAMNAQRQFNIVGNSKKKSTEKLTSGYRINRAADDAAGLAISEKMRRQIRGLNQGANNTQDGISLCQVADGALTEVHDMLHRITELSVKSANETNTYEDRQTIQEEIAQILTEIERISDTTEFNERKLFTGATGTTTIPAEYQLSMARNFSVTGTPTDLYASSYTITADASGFSIDGNAYTWSEFKDSLGNSLADTNITGGTYSFNYKGLSLSIDVDDFADIDDIVGVLNKSEFSTKKLPTVEVDIASLTSISGEAGPVIGLIDNEPFEIECSGNNFSLKTTLLDDNGDRYTYTDTWHNMRSYDMGPGNDAFPNNADDDFIIQKDEYLFKLYLFNSRRISFSVKLNKEVTLAEFNSIMNGAKMEHNFSLNSEQRNRIYFPNYKESYGNTIFDNINRISYDSTVGKMYDIGCFATEKNKVNLEFKEVPNPNEVYCNTSVADKEKYKDLAMVSESGEVFHLYSIYASDIPGNTKLSFRGEGTSNINIDAHITDGDWKSLINTTSGLTFDCDDTVFRHNEEITNMALNNSGKLISGGEVILGRVNPADYKGKIIKPEEKIYSDEDLSLWIQSGVESGDGMHLTIGRMNASILKLEGMDVSTVEGAQKAINATKYASEKVSALRTTLGVQQNRLEHTYRNVTNIAENTTAAESQIRDTDMAKEMVELSIKNILEQAGVSMISQANQDNEGVLSLLQ